MRTEIILEPSSRWHTDIQENGRVYFTGFLIFEGKVFRGQEACDLLRRALFVSPAADPAFVLANLDGHFALIVNTPDFLLAAADKVRSTPIFYALQGMDLTVSNDPRSLRSSRVLYEHDDIGLLEFRMAGYVTGRRTLVQDLCQVQAGEHIYLDKKASAFRCQDHYLFRPSALKTGSDEELLAELDGVNGRVFQRLIASLDGRPVWLPLSGGLDSRWVLAMLLRLGYKNIQCFTYGKPGHPEIDRAREIAGRLNVKWLSVIYEPRRTRELYRGEERKRYSGTADNLCSIPFLNDFYALQLLREKKLIPDDAVLINGQTGDFLTGGHIPKRLAVTPTPDTEFITTEIINKHFSLWLDLKTPENLKVIRSRIREELRVPEDARFAPQEAAQLIELWEWRERQAKFVVNQERVYEWFGYDWRLPLWDDELMRFWQNVPWEKRFGQRLQKMFLNTRNFGGVFNGYKMGPHPVALWERAAVFGLLLRARLKGEDVEQLARRYLAYFTNYAPFYIQDSYREFLKDSAWHRNTFSYFVKDYLAVQGLAGGEGKR